MTVDEFNLKWQDHLEKDHYGLAINDPRVIEACDNLFTFLLSRYPDFTYSQIKLKFGLARVYMSIDSAYTDQLENTINNIINEKPI